jgi:hypothetical protein
MVTLLCVRAGLALFGGSGMLLAARGAASCNGVLSGHLGFLNVAMQPWGHSMCTYCVRAVVCALFFVRRDAVGWFVCTWWLLTHKHTALSAHQPGCWWVSVGHSRTASMSSRSGSVLVSIGVGCGTAKGLICWDVAVPGVLFGCLRCRDMLPLRSLLPTAPMGACCVHNRRSAKVLCCQRLGGDLCVGLLLLQACTG